MTLLLYTRRLGAHRQPAEPPHVADARIAAIVRRKAACLETA
jgi:hypothetical protein